MVVTVALNLTIMIAVVLAVAKRTRRRKEKRKKKQTRLLRPRRRRKVYWTKSKKKSCDIIPWRRVYDSSCLFFYMCAVSTITTTYSKGLFFSFISFSLALLHLARRKLFVLLVSSSVYFSSSLVRRHHPCSLLSTPPKIQFF